MKTKLIFVRHGQSEANLLNRYAGHHDFALTDLGREQARRTAAYLADWHIDVLYASDLSRAQETAAPIARDHGLAICTEVALRELYFGSLEGVDVPVLERENPDFVWAWNNDFCNLRCPDGESVAELYARMEEVCARIARENAGKTVCCVTHGAALRALRCVWEGKGVAQINRLGWASNASVSVVTYEDGTYTVQVYGDDAHIADIRTQVGDRAPGECK